GPPWSIHVADVKTGAGREIWKAEGGVGSVFHGISAEDQIFWAAGERLIFGWERTGWLDLYSVPVEGGAAKLLTPGAFEVEDVAPKAIPSDFPTASLVVPQQVIFAAADGLPIHGQLFLPPPDGPGPSLAAGGVRHPAILFFHGGSRRQMLLGWHYMGYYHNAY